MSVLDIIYVLDKHSKNNLDDCTDASYTKAIDFSFVFFKMYLILFCVSVCLDVCVFLQRIEECHEYPETIVKEFYGLQCGCWTEPMFSAKAIISLNL